MSKFKFEIKLKQHIPIIHFQHDQTGATLRTTELKPKLDKFLKQKVFNDNFNDYKTMLVGWDEKQKEPTNNDAFNYKVNITAKYNTKHAKELRNPLFFGNMGDENKKHPKKLVESNDINISFFALNGKIIELIKFHFAEFLLKTNFGTRQSKGFGSFYIDPKDENHKNPFDILINEPFFLYYQYKSKNVFNDISVIYNLMKSGINYPDHAMIKYINKFGKEKKRPDFDKGRGKNNFYFKSFLTQYFHKLSIGNEKHFIKENFFSPNVRIPSDSLKKRYIRSMLGVAGGVEFRDGKRNGDIEYKSKDIERFKSPLLFKIIDDYVFIIPEIIPEKLKKASFNFINEFKSKTGKKENKQLILTPENFNLNDFLKKYANYFNQLDISCLDDKSDKLCNMIKSAKKLKIKIHEVQNDK